MRGFWFYFNLIKDVENRSNGLRLRPLPAADEGSRLAAAATQKISSKQRLAKNFLMLQTDGAQFNWTHTPKHLYISVPIHLVQTIKVIKSDEDLIGLIPKAQNLKPPKMDAGLVEPIPRSRKTLK